MNFFNRSGKMALGSRLRMLSERMMEDAQQIYNMYDVGLKPKWFPVFYILSQDHEKSITEMAGEMGHSHPSVVKIVREMATNGIVEERRDKADGRRNLVTLSEQGKQIITKIADQYTDVNNAIQEVLDQSTYNIWKSVEEFEFLLEQSSLLNRVRTQKKKREAQKIKIVPYEAKYREGFKRLNEAWINTYFEMEEADRVVLEDPEKYILEHGGYIAVALYDDEPVGVCALLKMDHPMYDFELIKMAVSPKVQGKGIGFLLGESMVSKARALGAKRVYLESNTRLKPAIAIYQKLGFEKVTGDPSPYERCNIQMAMDL